MILSAVAALFCGFETVPSCIMLNIGFPGPATEAACAAALSEREPQFMKENPGYVRVPDWPVECHTVETGGTPVRASRRT